MSLFDYFLRSKKPTASIAKERLQIVVAHERNLLSQPDYLPMMQKELMEVIQKYITISQDQINIALENSENCSVLELNVTLPQES